MQRTLASAGVAGALRGLAVDRDQASGRIAPIQASKHSSKVPGVERALIPSLLDKLRLKGSLVTIDAAGCHRPIADRIVEAEADYLLTVKANQPKLLVGIKAALEQAAPQTVQCCERAETSHGRQEHRRCTVVPAPAGLGGKTPWAGLKSVAAVHGTFVRGGKVTTLTRYYITSRTLTADQLLEAVRGHWSIEK